MPRFFEAAKGDRFEALFVLSMLTGVRPAKARALRWPDVDLSRGELAVRRSVVELDGRPPKIVDGTKTKRARVVPAAARGLGPPLL